MLVDAGCIEQSLALGRIGLIPAIRYGVAGQELAHLARPRRPPVPDDLRFGDGPVVTRRPRLELRVDDRVELFFRRIPRLEQVIVEVDDIDRLDRGPGVGVRGEQNSARARVEIHGRFEELQPGHLRHAVVGEQHGDLIASQAHLAQRLEGLLAGLGPHDAVALAVVPS